MIISIEELWKEIPDFPGYSVSNHGNVVNNSSDRLLKPQQTMQKVVYVPLVRDGEKYTRSIKLLVAVAFVPGQTNIFDTPINKDGNKKNNHAENLVWRPRWFAVKYSRQFLSDYKHIARGPVYLLNSEVVYKTIYEAAISNGLLFTEVFRSAYSQTPVFPTEQKFRIPNSIQVR